jgi:5-methyltetrahydrofolate corrinoid/iron sulfur protein methyltransferase
VLTVADNLNLTVPWIAQAVETRDRPALIQLIRRLERAGADMIDLNLGYSPKKGASVATWLVSVAGEATSLPLCLDTADPVAMRAGLEAAREMDIEPPLINSFSLERDKVERILPLAAEFDTSIVGYCVRDVVPRTADERLEVAVELAGLAEEAGLPRERLVLDPILFPLLSFQDDARRVLGFFRALPDLLDPPPRSMAGVSNISWGLPRHLRPVVEAAFLPQLAALGLDLALTNMLASEVRDSLAVLHAVEGRSVFSAADIRGTGGPRPDLGQGPGGYSGS